MSLRAGVQHKVFGFGAACMLALAACGGAAGSGQGDPATPVPASSAAVSERSHTLPANKGDAPEPKNITQPTVVTCQTATFYANYTERQGPSDPIATLTAGERLGYRYSASASWSAVLYYRTSTWGFMLTGCHDSVDHVPPSATSDAPPITTTSVRRAVCARDVYVRDSDMRMIGTLFTDETIDVERYAGNATGYFAVGFAYGHVNRSGYVLESALCP